MEWTLRSRLYGFYTHPRVVANSGVGLLAVYRPRSGRVVMYYNIETEWPISCDEPVTYRHDGDTEAERGTLCPFYHLIMERNVYEENSNIWIN